MFGFRFRQRRPREGRMHPLAIVGICLAVAILLTLIVGNFLKLWLDDDTYQKLTQKPTEEPQSAPPSPLVAKKINAYPFSLGENAGDMIGTPAVSVALNTKDGTLLYTSDVAAYLGCPRNEQIPLFETVSELSAYVSYISGVFYPQSFTSESTDVFYASTVQEAALIREFFRTGGSELLLLDMPLTNENLDRVTLYLDTLRAAADDTAIGVAIPLSVASSEGGWEILGVLEQHCDFLALDVTDEDVTDTEEITDGTSPAAVALLTDCNYYLTQYNMRLLLSTAQTNLLTTLEMQMHQNYQVVAAESETVEE